MAAELTPDDAVRAIQDLTRVLSRWARWQFWLLAALCFTTAGAFVVGVRTHAAQNEALRQVMQENRAIFERLSR